MRAIAIATVCSLIAPLTVTALDVPISVRKLVLKTEPTSAKRRFLVKTVGEPGIVLVGNPTTTGATLFAAGLSCVGPECAIAGSTGSMHLPASFWRGLGNPPGSGGYRYKDPNGTAGGVRAVVLKPERLTIKAVGPGWTWLPAGGEDAVVVTMSINTPFGVRRYCAELDGSQGTNLPGYLSFRDAQAPSACRALCGNGVIEGAEECEGPWLEPSWVLCENCQGCTLNDAPGCDIYPCCNAEALCRPPVGPGGGPGSSTCALPSGMGDQCGEIYSPAYISQPCEDDLFCEPELIEPIGFQGTCCSPGMCDADSDCCFDGVCAEGECCGPNGTRCGVFLGDVFECCAGQVCCDGTNCADIELVSAFNGHCCGDLGAPCSDGAQCCSGTCDTMAGACQ